jgi:hypothetical protein
MVRPMGQHLRIETLGFAQIARLYSARASAKACGTLKGAGFGNGDGGMNIPLYREVKKLC